MKGEITALSMRLRLAETRDEARAEVLAAYARTRSLGRTAAQLGVSLGTLRRVVDEDPILRSWIVQIRANGP